jgi:CO/xanthine dehydrogenase Mo-binding subunit
MSNSIGKTPLRKEGAAKVSGAAKYIDDLSFDQMLYGVTVRSHVPRAILKEIKFDPEFDWSEFTLVTARDIPGKNAVTLLELDQPFLADTQLNHVDEPVALLAHKDKYKVEQARKHVTLVTEALPPIFSIKDSLAQKHVIWGKDNVFKKFTIQKGNTQSVLTSATKIFEGTYETGAQEQLYIENQGVIAIANLDEGVTIWGSMQCPYYVHKAIVPLFALPPEKVRIIQTETGGGFGGKEEYPSILAGHAALLAWKSGKPVKMIYSRSEDIAATTKRHPSITKIRSAFSAEAKLQALEIDFTLDGGAYCTLSPVVLSRGTIHAPGPYACENITVTSTALATNHPPHGAFRGFGAPQSIFALERHLDEVAYAMGLSPLELRRKNFIKKGQTTATEQKIIEEVDFDSLLTRALKESDYEKKQKKFLNENPHSPIKRGMGVATFMHGAGFTGSGERMLASVAGVEWTKAGKLRILAASTEIGQGTNTIFSQIAAQTLGLEMDDIEVLMPDTKHVPNSGPTVASRTVMIVGKIIEQACQVLAKTLSLPSKHTRDEFISAANAKLKDKGELKSLVQYQQPAGVYWDDQKYRGEAYATYAWAVYVAQVAVDTRTFETTVEDFVALQEVGKVIHPLLAAGQIEGGVAQAIGYALYEKVVYDQGRVINNQMTNYIMPTAVDVPNIRVFFEEKNFNYGPSGAKGIGELPMDGPAPAILNAIHAATGCSPRSIPLLPEDLRIVLKDQGMSS